MKKSERMKLVRKSTASKPYHDIGSGLDNVYLIGVSIYEDEEGNEFVEIPDVQGLHRVIAMTVAVKKSRLTPKEFRYLRKFMRF